MSRAALDARRGRRRADPERERLRRRRRRDVAASGLRAYLDIDPGFGQMWRALDLHDMFAGHDAYVTIGERIGQPDCTIPTCGLDWITTPQPVVLGEWQAQPPAPDGAASRPSRAGAGRSRRSSTRASRTGCACTSSAASPSCRAARTRSSRWRWTSTRPRRSRPRAAGRRTAGGWPTPPWWPATRGPTATTCRAPRPS